MIRAEYELYKNDYTRKNGLTRSFYNLTELENWLFGMLKRPDAWKYELYFPTNEPSRICSENEEMWSVWVHKIENDCGIIFSDGKYTNGMKHWNDDVKNWCKHCAERKSKPQFNFV